MSQSIVVFPTYNEIESLPRIVEQIRKIYPNLAILVVDDNSPDGTGALADDLAKTLNNFSVLHRAQKEGLGAAYMAAFEWCLQRPYQIIVQMDVDGSHRPQDLPKLLNRITADPTIDLVIGSRYIPHGQIEGWSRSRELLSRAGNFWASLMLKLPVKDATAGFRAYRAQALRSKIDFSKIAAKGFGFQVDMTFALARNGGKIVEVPILFTERLLGTSKMSRNIIAEAWLDTTKKGLTLRFGRKEQNGG
jgi:dolichol-phosphate mannosyltransferase